jgi:hypothetical protein
MPSWARDNPGTVYPPALASRKAPRLFLADGKPTLTPGQRALLRQAAKLATNLGNTVRLLEQAVATDDPVRCEVAVKSLLAIGLHLDDYTSEP